MLPYSKKLKNRARELRKQCTDSEAKLWHRLRCKQIQDVQFYRQKPIGPYIVDFYAPQIGLVVEVDGSQHEEEAHKIYDGKREAFLQSKSLTVLRFNNLQVLQELDGVLETIDNYAQTALKHRPTPLPPLKKVD